MKKYRILPIILITVLIVSLTLCGTVLAYMFRQTEYKVNEFTPANVSCEVLEKFDGEQKTSIQVQNTSNIDAYIRVRFVSYWVDAEGKIVAKPSEMPTIDPASGWLAGTNNTYYYQSPIGPGGSTPNLLKEGTSITLKQDENGYLQVIEVFAEAIQSKPQDAAVNSWKVTIDSSGNITAVP